MAEKTIIGIGVTPVPGVPPGTHPARCQGCGAEHKVQESTARTIARLGDGCIVACIPCITAATAGTGATIKIGSMRDAPGATT